MSSFAFLFEVWAIHNGITEWGMYDINANYYCFSLENIFGLVLRGTPSLDGYRSFWETGWGFLSNRLMIQLTSSGVWQNHRNYLQNEVTVCDQNHTHRIVCCEWGDCSFAFCITLLTLGPVWWGAYMYLGDDWASTLFAGKILAFLMFDGYGYMVCYKGPEKTTTMVGRSYFSNS